MKHIFPAFLVAFFVIVAGPAAAQDGDDWVVKPAAGSVGETVERLTAAVEGAGATVFATVDHAKGAQSIDAELTDMTLVVFGNPKIGTPILQAAPRAGLDLPLRVLVWDDNGSTMIGYLKVAELQERYAIEGADEALATMEGALNKLTDAAAGQ